MNVILIGLENFAKWDIKKDKIIFKLVPGTRPDLYIAFIVLSDDESRRAYSLSVYVIDYIPLVGENDEEE